MTVPKTTRTHLVYQFIILTLLFLGIGYNELLPDRKFVLFLAFVPMFCYQLFILSCCMELLPVPSWMDFGEPTNGKIGTKEVKSGTDSLPNSPLGDETSPNPSTKVSSHTQVKQSISDFPEITSRAHNQRRWEKSATNLRQSPKRSYPQKSKSWMDLSDSQLDTEKSLSREGFLDTAELSDKKPTLNKVSLVLNKEKKKYREERTSKVKSWKPHSSDFNASNGDVGTEQPTKVLEKEGIQAFLPRYSPENQEESELTKSYSFPFRQKRLETWLEMKENEIGEPNQILNRPYWQNASYQLAVKYEARRRRRAVSSSTECDEGEVTLQNRLHKSVEIATNSVHKPSQSKPAKSSASACINKIKLSFSNLIKKKDEIPQNCRTSTSKASKPAVSKVKNKILPVQSKKRERSATVQEFPQFLSTERPLIFYPKHLPFEKKRFESDVQQKIIELENE